MWSLRAMEDFLPWPASMVTSRASGPVLVVDTAVLRDVTSHGRKHNKRDLARNTRRTHNNLDGRLR